MLFGSCKKLENRQALKSDPLLENKANNTKKVQIEFTPDSMTTPDEWMDDNLEIFSEDDANKAADALMKNAVEHENIDK